MQFSVLDSYEPAIQKISRRMTAPNQVDHMGFDREDYRAKLRFVSWEAQIIFRNRHRFCEPQERRYVHHTLWNTARNWKRRRYFRTGQVWKIKDDTDSTYFEDKRLEARNALRVLESTMGSEFQVLLRVGEADGSIVDAHCPEEDGNFNKFRWRVRRLRLRAKEILESHAKI